MLKKLAIEIKDDSKYKIENILINYAQVSKKTEKTEIITKHNNTILTEFHVINKLASAIVFEDSFLSQKLIEFNQLNIVKNELAISVFDLYISEHNDVLNEFKIGVAQNNHNIYSDENIKNDNIGIDFQCGSIFSAHFWESVGMGALSCGVYYLSILYPIIANGSQMILAAIYAAKLDWLSFSDALASISFDWKLPKWITDQIYNATKTVSEWKIRTHCRHKYRITSSIII